MGVKEGAMELSSLQKLWALRILVPLKGYQSIDEEVKLSVEETWQALSSGGKRPPRSLFSGERKGRVFTLEESDDEFFTPVRIHSTSKRQGQLLRAFQSLYDQAEADQANAHLPTILEDNLQRLGQVINLSELERLLFAFLLTLEANEFLDNISDCLGDLDNRQAVRSLGTILGFSAEMVREALSPHATLRKTGFLRLHKRADTLQPKLELLSERWGAQFIEDPIDPFTLLRDMVRPSPSPSLKPDDFAHLDSWLRLAMPYMRQALDQEQKGVNVFLYGPPGTGKTQLGRILSAEIDAPLLEITSEDEDGDPIDGERRLRALQAGQAFFTHQRSCFLFDEMEDVFHDGGGWFHRPSTAQTHKAWINRILEENARPTIWISNRVDMDPAFLRRFDLVLELPIPPRAQREKILQKARPEWLDDRTLQELAQVDHLSPAVVRQATKVVDQTIRATELDQHPTAMLRQLLNHQLRAARKSPLRREDPQCLPAFYDPGILHTQPPLEQVAGQLREHPDLGARVCLYGPPGTGKTAWARWLAEQLERPLLIRRPSDLLSKWVGETEQNIAEAFRQAETDNAVLLLDEVDGFLQDRRSAGEHWEAQMVNEMLTQMESFGGIFLASTNLLDQLDPATLRRFDIKVAFHYLSPAAGLRLLQRYAQHQGWPEPDPLQSARIRSWTRLTPGDIQTVHRQSRLRTCSSLEEYLERVEAETALKAPSGNEGFGFAGSRH